MNEEDKGVAKKVLSEEYTEKFSGINRKIKEKTRIKKKFIWLKKLNNQWKFLEFAHVLQKCIFCYGSVFNYEWHRKTWLNWADIKWADKQTAFLNCNCNNELSASGSFISDDLDGVKYECTDCGRKSVWNFDLFPVAVNITDRKYPSPREMGLKEYTGKMAL